MEYEKYVEAFHALPDDLKGSEIIEKEKAIIGMFLGLLTTKETLDINANVYKLIASDKEKEVSLTEIFVYLLEMEDKFGKYLNQIYPDQK